MAGQVAGLIGAASGPGGPGSACGGRSGRVLDLGGSLTLALEAGSVRLGTQRLSRRGRCRSPVGCQSSRCFGKAALSMRARGER